MVTYYLIDGTENNKVVGKFDSHEEAIAYINAKEYTEDWANNWDCFQDYRDEFRLITSEEMEQAVKTYGSKRRKYWN